MSLGKLIMRELGFTFFDFFGFTLTDVKSVALIANGHFVNIMLLNEEKKLIPL